MPQIVWITSADGLNIYFNQQWVDYTGLTLEESHGEGWLIPFHPDDRQRASDAWQRAVQHRDTYSLECRLRRADGTYQWWLIRGVPLLSATGEIRKWFGTCTDIEQIKVASSRAAGMRDAVPSRHRRKHSDDAIVSIDEEPVVSVRAFNAPAETCLWLLEGRRPSGRSARTLLARAASSQFIATTSRGPDGRQRRDLAAEPVGTRLTPSWRPSHAREEVSCGGCDRQAAGRRHISSPYAAEDITERRASKKNSNCWPKRASRCPPRSITKRRWRPLPSLVVHDFADWCIVEIMEEHGRLRTAQGGQREPGERGARAHVSSKWRSIAIDLTSSERSSSKKQPLLIEHVSV